MTGGHQQSLASLTRHMQGVSPCRQAGHIELAALSCENLTP